VVLSARYSRPWVSSIVHPTAVRRLYCSLSSASSRTFFRVQNVKLDPSPSSRGPVPTQFLQCNANDTPLIPPLLPILHNDQTVRQGMHQHHTLPQERHHSLIPMFSLDTLPHRLSTSTNSHRETVLLKRSHHTLSRHPPNRPLLISSLSSFDEREMRRTLGSRLSSLYLHCTWRLLCRTPLPLRAPLRPPSSC
jgi:hypothetical protein